MRNFNIALQFLCSCFALESRATHSNMVTYFESNPTFRADALHVGLTDKSRATHCA